MMFANFISIRPLSAIGKVFCLTGLVMLSALGCSREQTPREVFIRNLTSNATKGWRFESVRPADNDSTLSPACMKDDILYLTHNGTGRQDIGKETCSKTDTAYTASWRVSDDLKMLSIRADGNENATDYQIVEAGKNKLVLNNQKTIHTFNCGCSH
jgi:hypothetical protein